MKKFKNYHKNLWKTKNKIQNRNSIYPMMKTIQILIIIITIKTMRIIETTQ